ncbi:MAG: hypothetical protein GY707_16030, partial [Desulfobacteraceae bacterium]|nr:hypothetical protein [Desulfobacteraceae bacterium]
MFTSLQLKYRLLFIGLICAICVGLSGGVGILSLRQIHGAMKETANDVSLKLAQQNLRVIEMIKLREIVSDIQNVDSMQEMESIF